MPQHAFFYVFYQLSGPAVKGPGQKISCADSYGGNGEGGEGEGREEMIQTPQDDPQSLRQLYREMEHVPPVGRPAYPL